MLVFWSECGQWKSTCETVTAGGQDGRKQTVTACDQDGSNKRQSKLWNSLEYESVCTRNPSRPEWFTPFSQPFSLMPMAEPSLVSNSIAFLNRKTENSPGEVLGK